MSYTKTVWRNNQAPAINADNLNHIEQGIESAHNQMAINTSDIETLTTQVQGNANNIASEISARQSGDSSLQSQIDQIIAPSGEAPSAAEVENARIGDDGVTYDTLGNAIRGQFADVKSTISDIASTYTILTPYLYKKDAYINSSGVVTTLAGYDIYRIPIGAKDVVNVKADASWWGSLSTGYAIALEDTNGDRYTIDNGTMNGFALFISSAYDFAMLNNGNYKAVYVMTANTSADIVKVSINYPYSNLNNPLSNMSGAYYLTEENCIKSVIYLSSGSNLGSLVAGYYNIFLPVFKGDKFIFYDDLPSGLSLRGMIRYINGTDSTVNGDSFICSNDGVISLWCADSSESPLYCPANSFKIDESNILHPSGSNSNIAETKVDNIASDYTVLAPYLYKTNAYINSNVEEADLSGWDLYQIPINVGDIMQIKWDDNFIGNLSYGLVFHLVASDNSIVSPSYADGQAGWRIGSTIAWGEAIFMGISTYKAVIISVKQGCENLVKIYRNNVKPSLNAGVQNGAETLNESNTIKSVMYIRTTGVFNNFYDIPNYYSLYRKVKSGDKVLMSGAITGLSYAGLFVNSVGVLVAQIGISDTEYIAPSDGILMLFINTTMTRSYMFCPADSIKIEGKNIINFTGGDTQFQGKSGVAFGTSLTYRAISSYGYLTTLEELSGITFDNQGIGSSKILGNMLTAIKNYSSYASKDICLLEGFVNDWYQGEPLGTWKDTTETTVCGCVRSALNYMLSQNANLTVFLILDHYGRNSGGVDCSTLAVNEDNVTQFEFYSEIAKVAESLGIPVIREFEDSGISENTPQYLADNIHCNALGAQQSGYVIWYQMKQYPVNL